MQPPETDRAAWLEQLVTATQAAIDRLRRFDDAYHVALLRDFRAFHDRLNAELGRSSIINAVDERGRRVGENEALFRDINERLRDLGEGFSLVAEEAEFVCECADTTCAERIRMSLPKYEEVRTDPKRFFVIKGHEIPEYEKVVQDLGEYVVVEKLPGGPAGLAIREDPRS